MKDIRDEIIRKQDELINHFKNYFHPIDSKCFDKSRQEINRITIEFISEIVSLKAELEKEKEIEESKELPCPYGKSNFCGSCNTDTCLFHPNFNG